MATADIVRVVLIAYAGSWAIYVSLLPLFAIVRRARASESQRQGDPPSIAVIIPAKNMSRVIARCVDSLQACRYPTEKVRIVVVADHCNDDTEQQARAAGAEVLSRTEGPAGKTYALAWTIDEFERTGILPDLYVIVDATARVEPEFLAALSALWIRGEDIVVSHPLVDPENRQWFAKCLGLTLVHRNLQNWSRERLGLSALIEGRGMAYSRKYIKQHGWSLALPKAAVGSHPTEDWRHGVQAVEHGYRVSFADDARVITPLRDSLATATQQGVRWERGRMANAATHALRVFIRGVRGRSALQLFAGLDAMQPPVAILGAACAGVAAFSALVPGPRLLIVSSYVPLLIVGIYGLVVVARGRRDGIKPATLFWAPVYIAWRCASFLLAWAFLDRLDFQRKKTKDDV